MYSAKLLEKNVVKWKYNIAENGHTLVKYKYVKLVLE